MVETVRHERVCVDGFSSLLQKTGVDEERKLSPNTSPSLFFDFLHILPAFAFGRNR